MSRAEAAAFALVILVALAGIGASFYVFLASTRPDGPPRTPDSHRARGARKGRPGPDG
jgi:hypothetical protein